NASGVSNLSTTITSTDYYGTKAGTGAVFDVVAPPSGLSDTPRYKQVNVTSTWTDATGQSRTLALDTIVSPTLVDINNNSLDTQSLSLDGTTTPIVREYDPGSTAGVIPIAVASAGSQFTAATNPKPELLALNGNNSAVVGTSFNVLTYQSPV